jgi:hypothetical protein
MICELIKKYPQLREILRKMEQESLRIHREVAISLCGREITKEIGLFKC